jgi:hydroxymethylglutaryl-CoA lyase
MSEQVKIVECPRDAWQGLRGQIPSELKASYLRQLIDAGFTHIDAVSFVSAVAVPQMADAEQVLALAAPPANVEIVGVVVNRRGAERAVATGRVQTLGFPYSISAMFLKRNQHQTPKEAREMLEAVATLAHQAKLSAVAYVSMAFGNPYGESWGLDQVTQACDLLAASGVRQISLADTVGSGTPEQISEVFAATLTAYRNIELGIHLHARPADSASKIRAAYAAGCRRFDAAIGGLGGCPFAQDALVGNIPTETLVSVLGPLGAQLPKLELNETLLQANEEIARRFGTTVD